MHDLRTRCKRCGVARNTVVEAQTNADDHIGRLNCLVYVHLTVHPRHAEVQRVGLWKGADAQQGRDHRHSRALGKRPHLGVCTAHDDAAAYHHQRSLRRRDQACHLAQRIIIQRPPRFPWRLRGTDRAGLVLAFLVLHVLRHVHEHGTRPTFDGNRHGLAHDIRELGDVTHQRVVFRDRRGHTDDVGFLKCVASEHGTRHLTGDREDRRAVHVRRRESRDEVGCTGSGSRHTDAHTIAGARVAIRGVGRRLLVADEDMPQPGMPVQRVVERHDRPAGIAEQHIDAGVQQGAAENLTARQ